MELDIIKYITDHILCKYDLIYNKKIEITKEGDSYSMRMPLNNDDRPLMIGGQFDTDEDFAKFITGEIDRRRLIRTKYFVIQMTDENNQL